MLLPRDGEFTDSTWYASFKEKTEKMKTFKNMITTAALLLAGTGISNAAIISFSAQSGPSLTDFTFSLMLNKFDTNLGTLTGATIRFTGTDDVVSLNLNNTSNSIQSFRYKSTADFLVTSNTADATLTTTDLLLTNFDSGVISLGPAGSGVCAASTPTTSCNDVSYLPLAVTANTGDVAVISLNNYKVAGFGTFTLGGFTATGSTFVGGGGNVRSAQVTNGTAQAIVTYTYTPGPQTPEPATMALMGTSLLGLALIGRRRRSS